MKYRPELDGLRACAVSLVVATHANLPLSRGGFYGVDVFFVLSGYLITKLLLAEWESLGGIDLRRFYARRALRLYPALLFFLAGYIVVAPFFFPRAAPIDALLSALYLTDYTRAFINAPYFIAAHTWSLSVEEHFYVLWPIALILMLKRVPVQTCARIMFAAFVGFTIWRLICFSQGQSWAQIYFRFDTRASGLSLGCAYALWDHGRQLRPSTAFPWLGVAILLLAMQYAPVHTDAALVAGFTATELATLAIIHGLSESRGFACSLLSLKPFAYLGRLSYGVYLWHFPIVIYLYRHYGTWVAFFIGGAVACGLSALSYATLERVTRRISMRLRTSNKRPPQPLPAVAYTVRS